MLPLGPVCFLALLDEHDHELRAAGYARHAVVFTKAGNHLVNTTRLVFGPALEDWPPIHGFMLYDEVTEGHALFYPAAFSLADIPIRVYRQDYFTVPEEQISVSN